MNNLCKSRFDRSALILGLAMVLASFTVPLPAQAQGRAAIVGRLIRAFSSKFSVELAGEGTQHVSARAARVIARHGDDAAPVLEQLGPRALRLADDLPDDAFHILKNHRATGIKFLEFYGDRAIPLYRAHGDQAVGLLAKHSGAAPTLLNAYGAAAAPSIEAVSSDSAIRLARLADNFSTLDPNARQLFLNQLARGGDDFVSWVWKRRAEVFGSAALAVGVLELYQVGDGVARALPGMIPQAAQPPNPETHPMHALLDRAIVPLSAAALLITVVLVLGVRRARLRPLLLPIHPTRRYPNHDQTNHPFPTDPHF